MIEKFCPLINGECQSETCVFFPGDRCIVVEHVIVLEEINQNLKGLNEELDNIRIAITHIRCRP